MFRALLRAILVVIVLGAALGFFLGYRWSDHLLFKAEYSFSHGHLVNGVERDAEDLIAAMVAFSF